MKLRSPAGTRVGVPDHMVARYLARGWVPVGGEVEATSPPPATPAEPDPVPTPTPPDEAPPGVITLNRGLVPTGTAKDVIDWVSDDRDRAKAALEVEQGKGDDARTTLVARLSKLAGQ